jgi:hypothetical protein
MGSILRCSKISVNTFDRARETPRIDVNASHVGAAVVQSRHQQQGNRGEVDHLAHAARQRLHDLEVKGDSFGLLNPVVFEPGRVSVEIGLDSPGDIGDEGERCLVHVELLARRLHQ